MHTLFFLIIVLCYVLVYQTYYMQTHVNYTHTPTTHTHTHTHPHTHSLNERDLIKTVVEHIPYEDLLLVTQVWVCVCVCVW